MSNVAVTVQHDGGPAGLLGLYQGVPLTRRSTFYAGALPDRITIFRRAICAVCGSEAEVVERYGARSFTRSVITSESATHGCASSDGEQDKHPLHAAIRAPTEMPLSAIALLLQGLE